MGNLSNISDGLIDRWADEAINELGRGDWHKANPNTMMLAIYAIQRNRDKKLVSKITKPIWWLFGAAGTGIIWLILSSIFNI